MDVHTTTCEYEGIVEDGQIRLAPNVHLPEKAKVIVTVSNHGAPKTIHMRRPRLVHPEQAEHFFVKKVTLLED